MSYGVFKGMDKRKGQRYQPSGDPLVKSATHYYQYSIKSPATDAVAGLYVLA